MICLPACVRGKLMLTVSHHSQYICYQETKSSLSTNISFKAIMSYQAPYAFQLLANDEAGN